MSGRSAPTAPTAGARLRLGLALWCCIHSGVTAAPLEFDLPAQRADLALAAFTATAPIDLLYAPADLRDVQSSPVRGALEPVDALHQLLQGTGFGVRETNGRHFVTRIDQPFGALLGRILASDGVPAAGTRVLLPEIRRATVTNRTGDYRFDAVPVGLHRIVATREGFHPLHLESVAVRAGERTVLAPQSLREAGDTAVLEAVVVEGRLNRRGPFDPGPTIWGPRRAGGNLDLNRTANDVLPFIVYDRDRIVRSGAVNLNEFLRRELLDSDATALPPEQDGGGELIASGSSNLNLRGFASDETVVLLNGRRLPEILTTTNLSGGRGGYQPPDVNFIPLSLVQQVQVLPASASALYSGNAVGGVINILLRPDGVRDVTEVTATTTNPTAGYSAAATSVSLTSSQTLLDGRLFLRLNANVVDTKPPSEAQLRLQRRRLDANADDPGALYRATPNVRSADGSPLFTGSTATVTSVAAGADGSGGLAAFAGRAGLRSTDLFDAPAEFAVSPDSSGFPYGRSQRRVLYFGSAVYEAASWLELGADAAYSSTVVNRGIDVFRADLALAADSPLNPFGRDLLVSLNETPAEFGENYNEARLEFYSLVGTALVKLPAEWQVALDVQYAHSTTRYRGLHGVDAERWQALVDRGAYQPLRDTQVHGPPAAFYDEVLVYTGARDRFVTVGDYETLDAAVRVTNESLNLPTGLSVLNAGADYRLTALGDYQAEQRYGDGTYRRPPEHWEGRVLERVSLFGELQTPVVPRAWLPSWLESVETDLAVRYIVADTNAETNIAPTLGIKVDFAGGFAVRGSFTTSNRFPTPHMSRNLGSGIDGGGGIDYKRIYDPLRNEHYDVEERVVINPDLRSESAVTQTAGILYQTGERHRFRASLDFFDTRKTNEIKGLGTGDLINLENLFPERVERAAPAPGDPLPVGRVTTIRSGAFNLARRHSQNWSGSLDYAVSGVLGGTLDVRTRVVYFQRFEQEILAGEPVIDEIRHPSGGAGGLLEYRATFGGGWSSRTFGAGFDGQYFHSRRLPEREWPGQGARTIDPFWQFDAYLQADLGAWLLPADSRYGLRAQIRVNNVFNRSYPFYANESTGAAVQPYGDWRGRTWSLSVTAEF